VQPHRIEEPPPPAAQVRRLLPEPPPGGWLSDEPAMETVQHLMQMLALIATLRFLWRDRTDYFAGGNLTIYFSPVQKRSEDFRGPDFFVVLGVDGTKPRSSWVVWEEGGRYPNLILEILSDSTESVDRGDKRRIYQDVFRTPEYFLFDPRTSALEGLRLVAGRYEAMTPNAAGRLASQQLGLELGAVDGEVRLFTPDGRVVAKPEEAALEQERRANEQERRANEQQKRAEEQQKRAEEQQKRAEEQQKRAEEQQKRAEAAEAELARLRARSDT
jgi:Uma2 family endonuclease